MGAPAALVLGLFVCVAAVRTAHSTTVVYSVVDLPDTTPGEDLWQYGYRLDEVVFTANQGFSIFFDRSLYSLLEDPPSAVNAHWDLLAVQPDLALASNGFFDALALDDNPSLADPFIERFVWLGDGVPGAQSFSIYNADFSTREQGLTLTSLAAWRLQYFGSVANSGDGADEADMDFDGSSNLLEFFFAQDPTSPGGAATLTLTDGPNLEITYTRNKAAAGEVIHHVEWTDALTANDWTSDGVSESVLTDDGVLEEVKVTLPAAAQGQRWFVRLRVTR